MQTIYSFDRILISVLASAAFVKEMPAKCQGYITLDNITYLLYRLFYLTLKIQTI